MPDLVARHESNVGKVKFRIRYELGGKLQIPKKHEETIGRYCPSRLSSHRDLDARMMMASHGVDYEPERKGGYFQHALADETGCGEKQDEGVSLVELLAAVAGKRSNQPNPIHFKYARTISMISSAASSELLVLRGM